MSTENIQQRAEAVARASYEWATQLPWEKCPEQNRMDWMRQAELFVIQLDAAGKTDG